MNIMQAVLLGLVQGLTEFLPVSSSGHLIIIGDLIGLEEADLLFDTLLHIGTLVSVLAVYGADVIELILTFLGSIGPFFRRELVWKRADAEGGYINESNGKRLTYTTRQQRFIVLLIFSLLPLILILPFKSKIEEIFSSTLFVGCALIVTSVFLFLSDRIPEGRKGSSTMTVKDSFIVGFVQLVAVLPGISRSGSTITAGLACGMKRKFAAKFSFIMSIPTILAAFLLNLLDIVKDGGINTSLLPTYLCGAIVAAISGILAIRLLQFLLKSKKFIWFSVYCLGMGIFAIIRSIL